MDKHLQILTFVTEYLTQANLALPLIFGVIGAISSIIKGVTGSGPSLGEIATLIEQQVAANDAFGQEEVARLRAMIPPPTSEEGSA